MRTEEVVVAASLCPLKVFHSLGDREAMERDPQRTRPPAEARLALPGLAVRAGDKVRYPPWARCRQRAPACRVAAGGALAFFRPTLRSG